MTAIRIRATTASTQPRVRIQAVERLLLRHVHAHIPEVRLVVAVICQAIADCAVGSDSERAEAQQFMRGEQLNTWATLVDLKPGFVREVAVKTGYLPLSPDIHHRNESDARPSAQRSLHA